MDRPLSSRRPKRQRGDAILEFAVLIPTLVIILFGLMEVGRVVEVWLVVHNAAREGARAGAAAFGSQNPATVAQTTATSYLTSAFGARTDIVATSVPTPDTTGGNVSVSVEADVAVFIPLYQSMLTGADHAVHVKASASMRQQ
jgi:Flp pilus assembly protein TadG